MLISLLSKLVLTTKSVCFNVSSKCSSVTLWKLWKVMYIELPRILISTSTVFVFKTVAVTKLLFSGILFSIFLIFGFKTVVVTKWFLPSNS